MLLSDELLTIGRTANPKNNQSQAEASNEMHERLKKAHVNGSHSINQLVQITKMVCDQLNKEGFKYYGIDIFFSGERSKE